MLHRRALICHGSDHPTAKGGTIARAKARAEGERTQTHQGGLLCVICVICVTPFGGNYLRMTQVLVQ